MGDWLMIIDFESKTIETRSIKVNGSIKKVIDKYKKFFIPMSAFLSDYYAVKSYEDYLSTANNPMLYYYKGIKGHEVEGGTTNDETAFRFALTTLKDQNPTDVINAAFYKNNKRNDIDFEIGYLLPIFFNLVKPNENILVVNPSPDIISEIENREYEGKHYYAVVDDTLAGLYSIQFPKAGFATFEDISDLGNIDIVLITNRDQKIEKAQTILKCLDVCSEDARILGLIPNAWLDNPKMKIYEKIKNKYCLKEILIVATGATVSTPRKKMIMYLEKGGENNIQVKQSYFDDKTKMFCVSEETALINCESYLKSEKTILSCYKEFFNPTEKDAPKYNKAEEYRFSDEISVFYKIYSERKNKKAGVAHYKEIKDVDLHTWGIRKTPDIEKGLRGKTIEEINDSLEQIVFYDEFYPIIRTDIYNKYIIEQYDISLKTIWFFCWEKLVEQKQYDHPYLSKLFIELNLANIKSKNLYGPTIIDAIANSLGKEKEEIPYKAIEQIDMVFEAANELKLISFNPLEKYVNEFTTRATERQQDVRNALVKKHFTQIEEKRVFISIIGNRKDITKFLCVERSIFLGGAIRLFTGMSIREVAALNWKNYKVIPGTDDYQLSVDKFVDSKGNLVTLIEQDNSKRFRIVPVSKSLSLLLNARKQYLLSNGIDEEYLQNCPIILHEEILADMKKKKRLHHCKPSQISEVCNEIIKTAKIPSNEVVLPDEKNDLVTDFNKYHGDIFLSNFRHKANHKAKLELGELNYIIGIDAPDTFSRHYMDYTNDFEQVAIITKLNRWDIDYERIISSAKLKNPCSGEESGDFSIKIGPFDNGVAGVDLIIDNQSSEEIELTVEGIHGINVNKTIYRGFYGKKND